mmetsp:Transcript_27511/g.57411  ORF Transcript_27511/g.57411 Transcript_27511/m.57411 type:complete len:267 (-) Transcript_27511:739-1539(-)
MKQNGMVYRISYCFHTTIVDSLACSFHKEILCRSQIHINHRFLLKHHPYTHHTKENNTSTTHIPHLRLRPLPNLNPMIMTSFQNHTLFPTASHLFLFANRRRSHVIHPIHQVFQIHPLGIHIGNEREVQFVLGHPTLAKVVTVTLHKRLPQRAYAPSLRNHRVQFHHDIVLEQHVMYDVSCSRGIGILCPHARYERSHRGFTWTKKGGTRGDTLGESNGVHPVAFWFLTAPYVEVMDRSVGGMDEGYITTPYGVTVDYEDIVTDVR